MRLSLRPKCTCNTNNNKHKMYCDLKYVELNKRGQTYKTGSKKKRFKIFYPLKKVEKR